MSNDPAVFRSEDDARRTARATLDAEAVRRAAGFLIAPPLPIGTAIVNVKVTGPKQPGPDGLYYYPGDFVFRDTEKMPPGDEPVYEEQADYESPESKCWIEEINGGDLEEDKRYDGHVAGVFGIGVDDDGWKGFPLVIVTVGSSSVPDEVYGRIIDYLNSDTPSPPRLARSYTVRRITKKDDGKWYDADPIEDILNCFPLGTVRLGAFGQNAGLWPPFTPEDNVPPTFPYTTISSPVADEADKSGPRTVEENPVGGPGSGFDRMFGGTLITTEVVASGGAVSTHMVGPRVRVGRVMMVPKASGEEGLVAIRLIEPIDAASDMSPGPLVVGDQLLPKGRKLMRHGSFAVSGYLMGVGEAYWSNDLQMRNVITGYSVDGATAPPDPITQAGGELGVIGASAFITHFPETDGAGFPYSPGGGRSYTSTVAGVVELRVNASAAVAAEEFIGYARLARSQTYPHVFGGVGDWRSAIGYLDAAAALDGLEDTMAVQVGSQTVGPTGWVSDFEIVATPFGVRLSAGHSAGVADIPDLFYVTCRNGTQAADGTIYVGGDLGVEDFLKDSDDPDRYRFVVFRNGYYVGPPTTKIVSYVNKICLTKDEDGRVLDVKIEQIMLGGEVAFPDAHTVVVRDKKECIQGAVYDAGEGCCETGSGSGDGDGDGSGDGSGDGGGGDTMYSCVGGVCVADAGGIYASVAACEAAGCADARPACCDPEPAGGLVADVTYVSGTDLGMPATLDFLGGGSDHWQTDTVTPFCAPFGVKFQLVCESGSYFLIIVSGDATIVSEVIVSQSCDPFAVVVEATIHCGTATGVYRFSFSEA